MKHSLYSLILITSTYCSFAFGMEHKASQRIVTAEQCQALNQLAKQAYQKGDYRAALDNFAQVILHTQQQDLLTEVLLLTADIYFQGNKDIKSNYKKALEIAQRAATFPEAKVEATILMGSLYARGDSTVQRNYTKAIQLLKSAYSNDHCLNTCVDIEFGRLYFALANEKTVDAQASGKAKKIALKYFQQAVDRNITCCPELPVQAQAFVKELSEDKKDSKNS